ncbi:hypothetical protein ACLI4Y_03355 [Natrialbaceae archaeon A-CW3]
MSDDASDTRSDETRPSNVSIEGSDTQFDEDATAPRADGNHDEWGRIPISQADGQREETTSDESIQTAAADETDDDAAYRPEPNTQVIDSGDVSLENAVFVVLGAVAMVLVMYRLGSVLVV